MGENTDALLWRSEQTGCAVKDNRVSWSEVVRATYKEVYYGAV